MKNSAKIEDININYFVKEKVDLFFPEPPCSFELQKHIFVGMCEKKYIVFLLPSDSSNMGEECLCFATL